LVSNGQNNSGSVFDRGSNEDGCSPLKQTVPPTSKIDAAKLEEAPWVVSEPPQLQTFEFRTPNWTYMQVLDEAEALPYTKETPLLLHTPFIHS
jgi:hypothetical protein